MSEVEWAKELSDAAKLIYGSPNGEEPYSDTSPIEKGWVGRFDWIWDYSDWCRPEVSIQICRGSRNWSMGTLNFDIFFFSLELGPLDFFIAYRLNILPPRFK